MCDPYKEKKQATETAFQRTQVSNLSKTLKQALEGRYDDNVSTNTEHPYREKFIRKKTNGHSGAENCTIIKFKKTWLRESVVDLNW